MFKACLGNTSLQSIDSGKIVVECSHPWLPQFKKAMHEHANSNFALERIHVDCKRPTELAHGAMHGGPSCQFRCGGPFKGHRGLDDFRADFRSSLDYGHTLYEPEVFGAPLPRQLPFLGFISNFIAILMVVTSHFDVAWVMGPADPASGTVSLHEVARELGVLYKCGWKPLRTIVIANWDAEESPTLTSEGRSSVLRICLRLATDASVSGSRWGAPASPSLIRLIRRSTLRDAHFDLGPYKDPMDAEFARTWDKKTSNEPRIGVAGSDLGFGNALTDARYHYRSIYDS
ncbi:hypothetical protein BDR04DRAFT_1164405 [Suillus decipiens]|nr:hypothetical protein BDR04DRAFT_1164405 [Suillus decipiens]